MSIHYSSESPEWYTPPEVLDLVRQVAPIGLDPCSSGRDLVGARNVYTQADNGLARSWMAPINELIYVNPPYGRGIGPWVAKCRQAGHDFKTVVALLPARVDTSWFQDVWAANLICFWRGRLKFSGHKNAAPFPSALAIWSRSVPPLARFQAVFEPCGQIVAP